MDPTLPDRDSLDTHYMTCQEIAEKLRVSTYTVQSWLRDGRLAGIRLGGQWRVPASALQKFLDARLVGRPTPAADLPQDKE